MARIGSNVWLIESEGLGSAHAFVMLIEGLARDAVTLSIMFLGKKNFWYHFTLECWRIDRTNETPRGKKTVV
jgi:hypothetical protein